MANTTDDVRYVDRGTEFEGYIARAGDRSGPGVLVFPDWRGVGDHVKLRCRMLADLGYTAFAADVYGRGVRPTTLADCEAESARYYRDRPLLKSRAQTAFEAMKAQNCCDPGNISAIGYCFGALTALELARMGAELKGVVSFHGNFNTPVPNARYINVKLLILHGDDDPLVPPDEVAAFIKEMKEFKIDYQFVSYSNTVHSFTNWDLPENAPGASSYSKLADKRSWQAMKGFLAEVSS